ncbi:hypothetical protein NQZ68_003239 [Dissostichus eleginoides]|nr:hypothetical protein NQZ68_003239 [Dissostichus eleginoides]
MSWDGSQFYFVDRLHPSAAERSLSQHLLLASVEGSLPWPDFLCFISRPPLPPIPRLSFEG